MSDAIAQALDRLPPELLTRLESVGFDTGWFLAMADRVASGDIDNVVAGEIDPPTADDIDTLPEPGSEAYEHYERIGLEAISTGRCALVVLAGGMATRMGGVVKALVEAIPGRTFLDLRLREQEWRQAETDAVIPLWLMTSSATDGPIRAALGDRRDGYRIATFQQGLSLRLTPAGDLFVDEEGRPSEHAPGHGDLVDALRRSGLLDSFLDRGGEIITIANLDNLGATIDPVVVGQHLDRRRPVTCEVVEKVGSDRGGVPVRLDGRPVILEEFRIPSSFDPAKIRVFNTNTFHVDARTMADLELDWTYFAVQKEVDGRQAVQLERLINELTHVLDTTYLKVPREGAESHYLPVKDEEELDRRRSDLEAVARRRGMVP